jgi:hypothetical protein
VGDRMRCERAIGRSEGPSIRKPRREADHRGKAVLCYAVPCPVPSCRVVSVSVWCDMVSAASRCPRRGKGMSYRAAWRGMAWPGEMGWIGRGKVVCCRVESGRFVSPGEMRWVGGRGAVGGAPCLLGGVVSCRVVRRDGLRSSMGIQYRVVWCGAVRAVSCPVLQYGVVWCGMA